MRLLVLSVSMKDQTQKDRMVKSNRLKVNYQYLCLIWPLVALVVIVSAELISDIHCGGNPQYEQKDDGGKRFINEVSEY